jgi:hypothetical protein
MEQNNLFKKKPTLITFVFLQLFIMGESARGGQSRGSLKNKNIVS